MKKTFAALLCALLLLVGCQSQAGVPDTSGSPAPPVSAASSAAEPAASGAAEDSDPGLQVPEPAASVPETEKPLTAADCAPRFVPDGWQVFVVRLAVYDQADRKEIGYNGLALAVPAGWTNGSEPDENGMTSSISFSDENGRKMLDIFGGRNMEWEGFPDEKNISDSPEMTPRTDLVIDSRPAAAYIGEPSVMDGGGPEIRVTVPRVYEILSGDYRIGMNAYPDENDLAAQSAVLEQILASAAVTPGNFEKT
ncbi:hypothetical protein [Anaerotruncus rubiinfantis]|uniref:hypothetical protein n=1 Tax=Anaerotruncus rubiinfantis TaxID=1720200 RepID=UPI0011C86ED2|nr:hypothetical protein [Anaerotruncus rubiinfantis]